MSLSPSWCYCDHCRLHADACHCQTCINPQCGEWVALEDEDAPNEGRCKWCVLPEPVADTIPCPPPTEPMPVPVQWRVQ